MNEILERVADALERAEVGYHLCLTRLVDGVSTYTLTYDDDSPPLEFDDNSDAYAHIAAKKRLKAAKLAIEAMREPTEAMIEKGIWSRSESGRYEPRDIAVTIYQAMVDAAGSHS